MQDIHMLLPIGSVLHDRYRVEELLGKGGSGAVYLVQDLRVEGNQFALKEIIDPDKKELARFTFEGKLLQRLDHEALPRVYRVFEDAQSARVYMLMDYINPLTYLVLLCQLIPLLFFIQGIIFLHKNSVDSQF